MRLLSRVDGKLRLTPDVPARQPYAILSHTWGKDEDEVTYQDLLDGHIAKPGFNKIDFCLTQAARDGYDYVWVDTCCIDKRDRNELGKAINLMYEYYQHAAICYVALSDIAPSSTDITSSRWFTRGWTLQELVAPGDVRFYAGDRFIGNREHLRSQIKEASGVDVSISLGSVSIPDRFKWSLGRTTREPEDLYYSLAGLLELEEKPIFNYGEGAENARERLFDKVEIWYGRRTRKQLHEVYHLAQRADDDPPKPAVTIDQVLGSLDFPNMDVRKAAIKDPLPSTCTWLLAHEDFKQWWEMSGSQFIWLKGKPGAGKSTIMKFVDSLVTTDTEAVQHISYYFNARGEELEHSSVGMYRSLLSQILQRRPKLRKTLLRSWPSPKGSPNAPIVWTLDTLQRALQQVIGALRLPIRCFVDALDEGEPEDIQAMVWFLQDLASPWLHICFASRYYPTVTIKHSVELRLDKLHSLDIERYVDSRLDAEGALLDNLKAELLRKANGIFLWAALVVNILNKELREGTVFNIERTLRKLPPTLAQLFEDIVFGSSDDDDRFRLCLYWVLFSTAPISGKDFYYAMEASLRPDLPFATREITHNVEDRHIANLITSSSRGLAELTQDRVQIIHESVREHLLLPSTLQILCPDAKANLELSVYDKLFQVCRNFLTKALESTAPVSGLCIEAGYSVNDPLQKVYRYNHAFLNPALDAFMQFAEQLAKSTERPDILNLLARERWIALLSQHLSCMTSRPVAGLKNLTLIWDRAIYDRHMSTANGQGSAKVIAVLISYDAVNLLRQACTMHSFAITLCTHPLLAFAVQNKRWAAAHLLLDAGADVTARLGGHSTIELALTSMTSETGPPLSVVTRLLLRMAISNESIGAHAVCTAARLGQNYVLANMAACGSDLSQPDTSGQTPLMLATAYGLISTIKCLVDHGADINGQNHTQKTALIVAARQEEKSQLNCY